jgi:hypothetical protein
MTRRTFLRAAGPLLALLALPPTAPAGEPFHGFFQPRGGAYYSPLHYNAPALYKLRYYCHGPECHGARVSVCPPGRPDLGPTTATGGVVPGPAPSPSQAPRR